MNGSCLRIRMIAALFVSLLVTAACMSRVAPADLQPQATPVPVASHAPAAALGAALPASPTPTPSPSPMPTPPPLTAQLLVVGDLMLHQWQVDDAYDAATGTYDFDKGFSEIAPYLRDGYTIGNLETVFGEGAFRDFPVFNGVDAFAGALGRAGFDLVTTANNHANDGRAKGILRTHEVLDAAGIAHVGTYASQEERDTVLVKEINGITFAFLSYTYGLNGIPLERDKPYMVNLINETQMPEDIRRARETGCDFVVVLPHLGNEYETKPRPVFQKWVRLMLDAGADLVLASHPHVLQPAEFIDLGDRKGFAAYSLGNFISSQRTQPRDAGVILKIAFEKPHDAPARITKVGFVPTWVRFYNNAGVYDIKVLPVGDTLQAIEAGAAHDLRPKDITRLKAVWRDAAELYGELTEGLDE